MFNRKHLVLILLVICGLAFFNLYLASSHPDGLERVAEDQGFIEHAKDSFSIFGDYALPLNNELLSTGLAGLLGVALTYFIVMGIGKFLAVGSKKVN